MYTLWIDLTIDNKVLIFGAWYTRYVHYHLYTRSEGDSTKYYPTIMAFPEDEIIYIVPK
jgi:predicted aminopeptidase